MLIRVNKLEFLADNLFELAGPEEILKHGWSQLTEEHSHEAEEALTHSRHLVAQQSVIELELLVGREEADLGNDEQF